MPCYGVFGDYYIQNNNYFYPDSLGYYVYVSDADYDGKHTILDATTIQRKLAEIE